MGTFKDLIIVNFYPLGIRDCLFRKNSNDNENAFYSNKEDFFTPRGIISMMTKVLLNERRCLFGKKIREFDFKFDLAFHQEFFQSTRFLACTSL